MKNQSENNNSDLRLPGLADSNVLILGGSGHLGSATARLLSRHASGLYLTYFAHRKKAEAVASDSPGASAFHVGQCDFHSPTSITNTFAEARKCLGALDAVVCSVGSQRRKSYALASITDDEFSEVSATQFHGVVQCCREAAKVLTEGGRIVLVSSIVASRGYIAGQTIHAALKAGVEGLVRHAATELAPSGVRLNAVAPGYIHLGENEPGEPQVLQKLCEATPMRKQGRPDDVATAVCFLLSSASDYVTGTVLHVDGGLFP